MRFSLASLAVVALTTQAVVADGWFGKTGRIAYNKWHETELERWLSDHDIPFPTPSDRKDLENLVQKNWENNVIKPYNSWDANQLQNYLKSKGQEIKKGTEKNKNTLASQVQGIWHETADQANEAYSNIQNWIFDTWTDSQLKAFLDYHDIPNPSPRTRDSLLHTARANYQAVANKAKESAQYPGNWLWHSWSDSDVKAWLDERGIPVPQPGTRDKLIARLRRNAHLAANRAAENYASATESAKAAEHTLSEALLESWSDSQIKEWFDKNGIKVPQGSKRNELIALARKYSAQLTGNNLSASAASAYGAATSSAGNYYAQNTNDLYAAFRHYYDLALNQVGLASVEAQSSLSSASASLSSASSRASVTASKSSSSASKAYSNAASSASKSASKSVQKGASQAGQAYKKATDRVKEEL